VIVLGIDTATASTAVAVRLADGREVELRDDPPPGERPAHTARLLPLIAGALEEAGLRLEEVDRIAVGTGPGSFTGLRIGVATARGLAQAGGVALVGVSTLRALAAAAAEREPDATVAAVVDARRGEAFAAAWRGETQTMATAALAPEALAARLSALEPPLLAAGDGAIRFRAYLEPAGAVIPPDDDPLHRVSARHVCRLGAEAEPTGRDAVVPDYVRPPDARPRPR
jgi:tRNA threonylcarbamoyladenosine biosynthesis protein TsaB